MISQRARQWRQRDPFLVAAHVTCVSNPYAPQTNPEGYINFGTAENQLLYDLAEPLLRECLEICERDTHYNHLHGSGFFRQALADFLSRRAGRPIDPDHLAVASGSSAVLENLSFVLCDPGDVILIPSPYYPGFDHDLALRSGARFVEIPLSGPDFALSLERIASTYESAQPEAAAGGGRVRALLLTSPHNPLGVIYPDALLRAVVAFAEAHGLHVIVDEIYAESLLPAAEHASALRLASERCHVVYGFAKDFGLSGYKVGVLHSENEAVIRAAQAGCYFYTVSASVQRQLGNLLRHKRLGAFLHGMRERLAAAHAQTCSRLEACGAICHPMQGSIVLWLDLRPFLARSSFAAERALFDQIFKECRVNLPPGQAFHCSEPGWFRLCYTVPEAHRHEGLDRLGRYLAARAQGS